MCDLQTHTTRCYEECYPRFLYPPCPQSPFLVQDVRLLLELSLHKPFVNRLQLPNQVLVLPPPWSHFLFPPPLLPLCQSAQAPPPGPQMEHHDLSGRPEFDVCNLPFTQEIRDQINFFQSHSLIIWISRNCRFIDIGHVTEAFIS
jgi:hypothetical protein